MKEKGEFHQSAKISDVFKERLREFGESDRLEVIVLANTGSIPVATRCLTGEERKERSKLVTAATVPIVDYLREREIQYKLERVLGQVYAFLTRSEIENLAQQEYVKCIMENQGFERLNRS